MFTPVQRLVAAGLTANKRRMRFIHLYLVETTSQPAQWRMGLDHLLAWKHSDREAELLIRRLFAQDPDATRNAILLGLAALPQSPEPGA